MMHAGMHNAMHHAGHEAFHAVNKAAGVSHSTQEIYSTDSDDPLDREVAEYREEHPFDDIARLYSYYEWDTGFLGIGYSQEMSETWQGRFEANGDLECHYIPHTDVTTRWVKEEGKSKDYQESERTAADVVCVGDDYVGMRDATIAETIMIMIFKHNARSFTLHNLGTLWAPWFATCHPSNQIHWRGRPGYENNSSNKWNSRRSKCRKIVNMSAVSRGELKTIQLEVQK